MEVKKLVLTLSLLVFSLTGCVVPRPQPVAAPAVAPTPADWNTALKGVVLNTGGVDCLQIRRANVDDCAKDKRFSLYCVEEDGGVFLDDTPKGCGVFYMKTLATCGDQIPADLKLKCRIDTDVPQPTATPVPTVQPTPVDPLKPCVDKNPSYCWHVNSRLSGGDCWADCQCVKRSVGPCAGVPTPKPTVVPTASPRPSTTPAPTATSSLDPCIHGSYNYCWHKNSLLDGNNCFSNCICLKRPDPDCKTSPYPSPVPTPSPSPAATAQPTATRTPVPTAAATPTPGTMCPAGQHPVWWCEPDATAVPTRTPTPTATSTPPVVVSKGVIQGGWFINECMDNKADGSGRYKWYNLPYVFSAYPKGFNLYVTNFGEQCTPNQEIWGGVINISKHWENTDAANIEIAKQQMTPTLAAIRERKQQIATLRAQGVAEAKLPKMPIIWIDEGSSGAYGAAQDIYSGGFYKTVAGKRTLKKPQELNDPLPGYVRYMVAEYQKEGVTNFAVAPYSFFWANQELAPAAVKAGMSADDYRGRAAGLYRPRTENLKAAPSPEQKRALLEANSPDLWPKGHVWELNPDALVIDVGLMTADKPDQFALKRDAAYYTMYLYALKGLHPEVTRVIGQLSNCGYNRRDDSVHWDIARSMLTSQKAFGYPLDMQIEGCQARLNKEAGKPWNTPLADCRALKAILDGNKDAIVSMWLTDIRKGLQLDYSSCR